MNGCDLTLLTRTQTSEQEYNDLMSSNRRPSTPTPATLPKAFHEETCCMFSQGRQNKLRLCSISQDFLKCCWVMKIRKLYWVSYTLNLIISHLCSRHFSYIFQQRLRRDMPQLLVHSRLHPFLCMRIINPVSQYFVALPTHMVM